MDFEKLTDDELKHRFMHHPPKGDQAARYSKIRAACCLLAMEIRDLTPVSPEQARSINAIDEAMMLANAAIARSETGEKFTDETFDAEAANPTAT